MKKSQLAVVLGFLAAHAAIELYAEAFEKANKLEMLEGFASHFGPDFYGLRRNQKQSYLKKPLGQCRAAIDFLTLR